MASGHEIHGLYKRPDGRWSIVGTNIIYTEHDENRAVQKFRDWQAKNQNTTVDIPLGTIADPIISDPNEPPVVMTEFASVFVGALDDNISPDGNALTQKISEAKFWALVRDYLINKPEYVARMTGIPEVAGLRHLPIPKAPIKLSKILDIYKAHADVKPDSKREAGNTFDTFVKITGAETLADLTTETLTTYRDAIKAKVKSPGTIAAYFGRIKWIIKFAKSEGEDAVQIDDALSRMAILKAPKDKRVHQPTPISRENFHAIYSTAAEQYPDWTPRLLVMLNCCLHFDEALDIEWSDFDFKANTFCTQRNKRGRVIRAATLWPETVEALQAIKRTGRSYVFVSTHGDRFNAKGQWKTWEKIRKAAGCPEVQMDDIRDGAYSAACTAPGVDEKYARLLAGHRSHGLQDNYVARNPAIVKPASDAVLAAYAPFPKSK